MQYNINKKAFLGGIVINCKSLTQLFYRDFDLKNIAVYDNEFENGHKVEYVASGRKSNLLHLVTSGEREYIINSKRFTVTSGNVIFIPDKTKYRTKAVAVGENACNGIGICFDMVESPNQKILLPPDVYYEWGNINLKVTDNFYTVSELNKNAPANTLSLKTAVFKLLHSLLSSELSFSRNNMLIKPALTFIAENYKENLPVKVYADQCNLSESYFRKIFLECMGMSPLDYRNEMRFAEAKRMYQNNYTLQQIAEEVGFLDASYLSKLYKKHTGLSLKNDSKIV